MKTIDADMVRRAVRLIGPAPKRHTECEAMVRTTIEESSRSVQQSLPCSGCLLANPSARRTIEWRRDFGAFKPCSKTRTRARRSPFASPKGLTIGGSSRGSRAETGKTIQLKAYRKMIAADQAINLLERFANKEISAKEAQSAVSLGGSSLRQSKC